jgi:hypothetical protein
MLIMPWGVIVQVSMLQWRELEPPMKHAVLKAVMHFRHKHPLNINKKIHSSNNSGQLFPCDNYC